MMTLTVMKKGLKKLQRRIINYRSYKHFSNEAYRESLVNMLSRKKFVKVGLSPSKKNLFYLLH